MPKLPRVLAAVTLLVLAACGRPAGASQEGFPADMTALVGTWSITAEPDAQLVLETSGFTLTTASGVRFGSWRADAGGAFVATVDGAEGGSAESPPDLSTPAWLADAVVAEIDGTDRVLRDAAGAETTRLTGDPAAAAPLPDGNRPPAPLPAGVVAALGDRLVGRWEPEGGSAAPEPPHVDFTADGAWTGSDGCNGTQGRWTSGPDGVLVATSGPTTLIGCDGQVDVAGWLAQAARAGFDGPTLVLLDAAGTELGRLDPA